MGTSTCTNRRPVATRYLCLYIFRARSCSSQVVQNTKVSGCKQLKLTKYGRPLCNRQNIRYLAYAHGPPHNTIDSTRNVASKHKSPTRSISLALSSKDDPEARCAGGMYPFGSTWIVACYLPKRHILARSTTNRMNPLATSPTKPPHCNHYGAQVTTTFDW